MAPCSPTSSTRFAEMVEPTARSSFSTQITSSTATLCCAPDIAMTVNRVAPIGGGRARPTASPGIGDAGADVSSWVIELQARAPASGSSGSSCGSPHAASAGRAAPASASRGAASARDEAAKQRNIVDVSKSAARPQPFF